MNRFRLWNMKGLSIAVFSLVLLVGVLEHVRFVGTASAAGVVDLRGWAWSSNVGWISFNSTNPGAGGGAPYKVTYDQGGTELLDGYAWSSGVGWISFKQSDLIGCFQAPCEAKIDGARNVTGWARALSAGP